MPMQDRNEGHVQNVLDSLTRRDLLKGTASLAAVGTMGSLLAACGSTSGSATGAAASSSTTSSGPARRGGTLSLALTDTEASETLDPATAAVSTQFVLAGLLFNTLITADITDWSLHPSLAESWEPNHDFTQYQIKLRKGVEFHNGKPLTADDVVWSIARQLNPKVASAAAVRAKMSLTPDSAKAVDASTVLVKLTRPDSQLPNLLARPFLSIVPNGQTKFTPTTTLGTGPFKLDAWQAATSWKVSRNPNYWESGLPYLDGIDMVVNSESAARLEGVITGQFQLAEEIDYSSARASESNSSIAVLPFNKGINRLIVMDCSVKPFTDPRVRLAFKLAMNRSTAVSAVYADFAVPTSDLPLPPTDPYYPKGLGVRAYDPEQAKHLLAQAGYPNGVDMQMFTSSVVSGMPQLAVTFAQSAAAAGIRVKTSQWAASTYWDQVWLVKPFYTTYWATPYPPDYLWYVYGPHAQYNEAKLKLNPVATAYDQIMRTGDRAKQISLTQNVYGMLANDWGHVIPGDTKSPWVSSPKLKGVQGDPPAFRVKLTQASLEA
jgi:peptide/nickel transport system substrate-binding protein